MIIDSHCHLDWDSYQEDFSEVLLRAKESGVERIVTIGVNKDSNMKTRELLKNEMVYRCVGYHPDIVVRGDFSQEVLEEWMRALEDEFSVSKTVGIGECGLDYYCLEDAPEKRDERIALQKELFKRQIEVAIKNKLPLSLHVRDTGEQAYGDVLAILKEYFTEGETSRPVGVLHCVSGSMEYIQECMRRGFVVSFAGNVTYKNAHHLHELARSIPLEQMVLETDGPFLTPVPHRGKRNESAYTVLIAQKIAELKMVSIEEVQNVTTHTALRLFDLGM